MEGSDSSAAAAYQHLCTELNTIANTEFLNALRSSDSTIRIPSANTSQLGPIVEIIVRVPTIRCLDLSSSYIADDAAEALHRLISESTTLATLDISHTAVGAAGVAAVFEALYRNRKSAIADLRLSGLNIPIKELPRLMGAASCSPSLTSLHLSECSLPPQAGGALACALRRHLGLKELHLAHNSLGTVGFISLLSSLKQFYATKEHVAPLRVLDVRFCDITSVAMEKAAEMLQAPWCGITELYLGGNGIGSDGTEALAHALLTSNPGQSSLRVLGLTGIPVSQGAATALRKAQVAHGKRLTIFGLDHQGESRSMPTHVPASTAAPLSSPHAPPAPVIVPPAMTTPPLHPHTGPMDGPAPDAYPYSLSRERSGSDTHASLAHSQVLQGDSFSRGHKDLSLSTHSVASQQSEAMDVMKSAVVLMKSLASNMQQPDRSVIHAPQGVEEVATANDWQSVNSIASTRYTDAGLKQELDEVRSVVSTLAERMESQDSKMLEQLESIKATIEAIGSRHSAQRQHRERSRLTNLVMEGVMKSVREEAVAARQRVSPPTSTRQPPVYHHDDHGDAEGGPHLQKAGHHAQTPASATTSADQAAESRASRTQLMRRSAASAAHQDAPETSVPVPMPQPQPPAQLRVAPSWRQAKAPEPHPSQPRRGNPIPPPASPPAAVQRSPRPRNSPLSPSAYVPAPHVLARAAALQQGNSGTSSPGAGPVAASTASSSQGLPRTHSAASFDPNAPIERYRLLTTSAKNKMKPSPARDQLDPETHGLSPRRSREGPVHNPLQAWQNDEAAEMAFGEFGAGNGILGIKIRPIG